MAAGFRYEQAEEIAQALKRHEVRFLFIGKGAAILLGFPDTTQDADLFIDKEAKNCASLVGALRELGFDLKASHEQDILRGKDFVQIRYGPFDLDLIFAPDGIESFSDARKRSIEVGGVPVCHPDDLIQSKESAARSKDREVLPRLKAFRDWWLQQQRKV